MKLSSLRMPAAVTAVAAMAVGLVYLPGADDAQAAPVTETKSIGQQCAEDRGWFSAGPDTTLSPDNVEVTYPQEVHPGEVFTVEVQPGSMSARSKKLGRIKYDIALPEGATISQLRIAQPGTGLTGTPVVQRVNAAGAPDEAGAFARIWDGANSVNNGGNQNDSWGGGGTLQVATNTTWRLPKIAFDVTAPDTAGATLVTGLRNAGAGAGQGSRANVNNTMSLLATANATDAVYCTADAAGRTLTSTQVVAVPRDQIQATISLAGEARAADAADGQVPVELRATVGAADGKELPEGTEVVFYEGDTEVGRAPVAGGTAVVTASAPDEKATRTYRAVVADMESETQELTGAEASVDVNVAPISRTSLAVALGEDGVLVGQQAAITARYAATPSVPEGTEVIFRANGVRIGTAIAGADGSASINHAFPAAGPQRITAVVEEREVDGRIYPRAESDAATLTVADPTGQDTTTDLEYVRPDVDVEAALLTGDVVRFTATVNTGGTAIEPGATVSFFDGATFLGTAAVDPATGKAVFEHRFAERGQHSVRAVFNGQEKKNDEGVITEVLEPSTSETVQLDVQGHDVVIDNPEPTPGPDPEPTPTPGPGGSSGSSSDSGGFLASIIGILSGLGIIGQFLISILGLGNGS